MKIVVLAGGYSDERDVSLTSGSVISNALMKNGHEVLLVDLYKGLPDTTSFDEAYKNYCQTSYQYKVSQTAPDLAVLNEEQHGQKELVGKNVLSICQTADVVFLALHGSVGENGQVQAMLDLYKIKYSG